MYGGAASTPSDCQDVSSLMEQIQVLMTYAEDRNAKVSFLQSIIRKKQEDAIPSDVPRDLILEAKICIGDERKAFAHCEDLLPPMERLSEDERRHQLLRVETKKGSEDERRHHLLQVEKQMGSILSDNERAVLDGEVVIPDPKILNIKNVDAQTDTWSSLFQRHTDRSRDLPHHNQPSKDPDHHIEFDEEDSFAAAQN